MTNPTPIQVIEKYWAQFKTPAGAVAGLTAVVAILGEVGILNAPLTGALQTLLSAVLGVIVAAGAGKAAQLAVRRTMKVLKAGKDGVYRPV
jgi:hypothetical protein